MNDHGPWEEYEVADGYRPGDVVGVFKRDDPWKTIFTPLDMLALPHINVQGGGVMGSNGACIVEENGWRSKVTPNLDASNQ